MSSVELAIDFQLTIPESTIQKQIRCEYENTGTLMTVGFKTGMPEGAIQKPIDQEVMPGGIPLSIQFQSAIPENTMQEQIRCEYLPCGVPITIHFNVDVPPNSTSNEVWRFVKWTLGGPFNEKYYTIRSIEKPYITIDPLPILPHLRGQAYPDKKTPAYHTITKSSSAGITKTYDTWEFPRWYIELTYAFFTGDAEGTDFKILLDFITARRGSLEDFWYKDPDDNAIKDEYIGTGDGKTRSYQLCRTYCGCKEPIFAVDTNHELELKIDGVKQSVSKFTITNTGIVNFKTEPPTDAEITASFHFYYRCRFTEDTAEFENFAEKLWSLKTLKMVTTL